MFGLYFEDVVFFISSNNLIIIQRKIYNLKVKIEHPLY
jgi:hypothetical protein